MSLFGGKPKRQSKSKSSSRPRRGSANKRKAHRVVKGIDKSFRKGVRFTLFGK